MIDREFIKRLMWATEKTNPAIADVCQKQLKEFDNDVIQLELDNLPRFSFCSIPAGSFRQGEPIQVKFDSAGSEFSFRQGYKEDFVPAEDFSDDDFDNLDELFENL